MAVLSLRRACTAQAFAYRRQTLPLPVRTGTVLLLFVVFAFAFAKFCFSFFSFRIVWTQLWCFLFSAPLYVNVLSRASRQLHQNILVNLDTDCVYNDKRSGPTKNTNHADTCHAILIRHDVICLFVCYVVIPSKGTTPANERLPAQTI